MPEPNEKRPPSTWRLIAALALLHLLAAARFPWEAGIGVADWLRASPDLIALLAVGLLIARRTGARRWLSHPIALLLVLVPLYRAASTMMPVFYGKELELYDDAPMAPGLVHLLVHNFATWMQWALLALAALVAFGMYLLLHGVVRSALRSAVRPRIVSVFVAATLAYAVVGALAPRLWSASMLVPFTKNAWASIEESEKRARYADVLARAERDAASVPKDLERLDGADVYVVFVESYGRSMLTKPTTAARFAEQARTWEAELAAGGVRVHSGFFFPWVVGANSSLAHAQLLSGVEVPTRRTFGMLLASSLTPLPHAFAARGYRTIDVQPAMTIEWPEGDGFYGFNESLFRTDFDYEGHPYHWGYMPDQFALARLLHEVRADDEPVFAMYVSVTSHAPFSTIPHYLDDWSLARTSAAFAGEPRFTYPIHWGNYSGHPDTEAAYENAIRYSLTTLVGFVRELERPSLVIALGDHQPPAVGDLREFDHSRDVPMHVLSNRDELIAPFAKLGLAAGMIPSPQLPSQSTATFYEFFLRTFSAGE